MPVAISTRESSLTIWPKDSVSTSTLTGVSTLVTGTKTSNMGLERRSGMTQACTKDSTRMQAKRAKESTAGQMATATSENGARTC